MTSPLLEVQGLIYQSLITNAGLVSFTGSRIHDRIPESPVFPYVSIGPVQWVNDDASCFVAGEVFLQLDIWSRAVGAVECMQIADLIKRDLHLTRPSVSDNAVGEMRVSGLRVFDDPDGLTTHGVLTVATSIEERSS